MAWLWPSGTHEESITTALSRPRRSRGIHLHFHRGAIHGGAAPCDPGFPAGRHARVDGRLEEAEDDASIGKQFRGVAAQAITCTDAALLRVQGESTWQIVRRVA